MCIAEGQGCREMGLREGKVLCRRPWRRGEEETALPECLSSHEHGDTLGRTQTQSSIQGRDGVLGWREEGEAEC